MYLSYPILSYPTYHHPPSYIHTYIHLYKTLSLLPIITTIIIQQNPLNNSRIQTRPAPLSPSEPGENSKEPDKSVNREGVLFAYISFAGLDVVYIYIYISNSGGEEGKETLTLKNSAVTGR